MSSFLSASSPTQRIAPTAPLVFLYEHPQWFSNVFAEFERRGVTVDRVFIPEHFYDIGTTPSGYKVLFNRMSPSAGSRGHGSGIFHTLAYLEHLQLCGVRVINGARAFRYEISKASQGSLLKSLGLNYIPSRVIHAASQAVSAADGLRYPIIVKANTGGSGKGVTRFNTKLELSAAVVAGRLDLGIDNVALVQEFVPARGGVISRIETLGGRYLYGITVHLNGETFDLCPADICQTAAGQALQNGCVVEAVKSGLKVEGYEAPPDIRADIERIVAGAGIDVGGIEYMVDDRDGKIYYYDINALSNFVADARQVIGFDPVENLVDYLLAEVRRVG